MHSRRATALRAAALVLLAAVGAMLVTDSGARLRGRPSVSARLSPAVVQVNTTVRISGRARGLGSHPRFALQRRVGGSWQRVAAAARRRSGGRYVLRWRAPDTGIVRLRVRARGAGRSATSRSIRFRVTMPGESGGGTYGAGNWPPGNWRPFASSSPFYRPLPDNPRLADNSSAIVGRLFSNAQSTAPPVIEVSTRGKQGGTPTYFSGPADPVFKINCTRSWGGCGVDGARVHIPAGAKPEGGRASRGRDADPDAHMTIIDQAAGMAYDLWQVQESPIPSTGGRLNVSFGGRFPLSGDGLESSGRGGGGGSNAALFSDIIGRPRIEAIEAGDVPHAITIVISCSNGQAVYPGAGSGTKCPNASNAPAMGTRFQLAYSDAQIDALNAPEHRKVLYRAMAHYGLIVGDTEGDRLFNLELDSDYTYNSFGQPSRWLDYAKTSSGWKSTGDGYVSDLGADGIDWHRLRVIAPCVSRGSC